MEPIGVTIQIQPLQRPFISVVLIYSILSKPKVGNFLVAIVKENTEIATADIGIVTHLG